jgi:hypothetical protein
VVQHVRIDPGVRVRQRCTQVVRHTRG